MKTKLKTFLIQLLCLSGLCSLISCKKFLEIPAPKSEVTSKTVFNDPTTATAALTVVYSKMAGSGGERLIMDMISIPGLYGDELQNQNQEASALGFYLNFMNSTTLQPSGVWNEPYTFVYEANVVLEGLALENKLSAGVKAQLRGEALFIRSFWYYYLAELFGNVPFTVSTDVNANLQLGGSSRSQVLSNIEKDLLEAEGLISNDYVNASSTGKVTDRVRPNKAAVRALLSRVLLAEGKYGDAEQYASLVIGDGRYKLATLDGAFLTNSNEAIWQLMLPSVNYNQGTVEATRLIINQPAPEVSLSDRFVKSFEAGDQRRQNWIGEYRNGADPVLYYAFKYKLASTSTAVERSTVLRLAEQYLIRAEARYRQGNYGGAAQDLTVIHNRAGLGKFETSSAEVTFQGIVQERRAELFCEWAHRWIDMKRLGIADEVMAIEAPLKRGTWTAFKKLWPLPQTDLDRARNLRQNPGY